MRSAEFSPQCRRVFSERELPCRIADAEMNSDETPKQTDLVGRHSLGKTMSARCRGLDDDMMVKFPRELRRELRV